ncbi:MAG: glutamine synthetase adenylyltransferase [Chloroflexota bacterium]
MTDRVPLGGAYLSSPAFARLSAAAGRARPAFDALHPHLLAALADCADPVRALTNFERFAEAFSPPALFPALAKHPRTLEIIITLFAGSQFLTEILLRNPEYINLLYRRKRLSVHKAAAQVASEALNTLSHGMPFSEQLDALRRYQRSELLRIGASDLLDLFDLAATYEQLSALADGLTRACLAVSAAHMGLPAGSQTPGFVVLALGKHGARELNYSSDIDLIFIAAEDARATTPLGNYLIEALSAVTSEGFLYRVDMRLRPWGNDGPLIATLPGYLAYLEKNARLWEKQALLKMRPVAGDMLLGEEFCRQAQALIFGGDVETLRASVHAMKQRTEEILHRQGRHWGEVKLGEGSIRDIEFVVQFYQMAYGARHPELRRPATLDALPCLAAKHLLSPDEARILTDGYIFLRTVEHFLQMMHYRQTYTLPSNPEAIALLARRLGFLGPQAGEHFVARYQQYGAAIRTIYLRHIASVVMTDQPSETLKNDVLRHLARLDSSYLLTFSESDIQRHVMFVEQLDDTCLVLVDAVPLDNGCARVTIVGYDYPGALSLICGLMFVYGFNILDGEAFTYEPVADEPPLTAAPATSGLHVTRRRRPIAHLRPAAALPSKGNVRRKIVDVFTVSSTRPGPIDPQIWDRYALDLQALLRMMAAGQRREARGELAKRVAATYRAVSEILTPLYPIDIEIDNEVSERYTVLRINAPDTVGFLYEFTNALAIYRTYIARVVVQSEGSRVNDILFVTDDQGRKITAPEKQRQLRAAAVLIKHFTHLMPHSPNPETALLHFRDFLGQLFQRQNWPDELASLERSDVLGGLARVLGVSDFLWDDFLRMQYANLLPVVTDMDALALKKDRQQLAAELNDALAAGGDWRTALNAFKDREMFRIDMRHILELTADFWAFAAELTDLAELTVQTAFERCYAETVALYGEPRLEDGSRCPAAVFALGKCGGRELGFASDIELMFIYGGKGTTSGPRQVSTAEFFNAMVTAFVSSILARQEGIFQVDLQLRPYGKAGSLSVALDAFQRYYAPEGPAWAYERQALVKMRALVGDEALVRQVVALRDEFVYEAGGDGFDVTAMRAMRERQIRHLVTGGTFNAKYSPGGLVDVEYLIQALQIIHGAGKPELRSTNLREAMAALNAAGILPDDDYPRLRKAHTFLRWLIDALRVVRGNAKDVTVPPYGSEEFAFLARRLLYGSDFDALRDDLGRYTVDVQEINQRLLA